MTSLKIRLHHPILLIAVAALASVGAGFRMG